VAVVVDTDVISYIVKGDTRGALYQPHLAGQIASISFMALAELELWTLSAGWGARRKQDITRHLRRYIVEHSSPALCRQWSEVMNNSRRVGRPVAVTDAWNAATALLLRLPLVTHNRSHFAGISNLTVISEAP
jgi:predicted nucleic acid-binding protein